MDEFSSFAGEKFLCGCGFGGGGGWGGGEGKEEEWIAQWIELLHSLRLLDIRSWLAVSKGTDASNLVYE